MYKTRHKKVSDNPEEVFSNYRIVEMERIVVMRDNDKLDSFSKADFKNLNKNDMEDILMALEGITRLEKVGRIKINLTALTLIFPGIEECDSFSIVDKPTTGLIYLNNKNDKRFMDLEELSKFCDATLEKLRPQDNESIRKRDYEASKSSQEDENIRFVWEWKTNSTDDEASEGKLVHLEQPMIPLPYPIASQAARDAYEALNDAQKEAACLMIGTKQELFKTVKAFHTCKQKDGQSLSSYLLKMKSYLDTLERLSYAMPNELGTLVELHAMLKLYEKGILKKVETLVVLAIREGKIQKDKKKPQGAKGKAKGKNKLAYAPKTKISSPPKRDKPAKDSICHHCKEDELYDFPNNTWVYDTGCGTHIVNTSQGLRESRKLKHGALRLYMGNGIRAAVEAIESFDLILPSVLIIVLDNCHFTPTVTRGVVSISRLVNNGYIQTFTNYGISVSKDNVFYFNAIPRDGIYEIDMHNIYSNVSSNYNVSNKRAKHGLDSYYLWHCHLAHINKKQMDMLQRDGLLQPTHDKSHKKCKSCISGKMARKPFPHQVERAKDMLGCIHTDVCGPFRTVSREGANYFITFTDDFNRYGFVYLMKHKHEVFETFKVFQNEVENQLGKKIKAIRSDRVGEYLSHEFVNHMKSYGIVTTRVSGPEEEEFEEEEEPQEEEDDMEVDIEEDGNEPKLTYPYEEVDPLNPPPPASDSELEDVIEVEDTIESEDETVPASVYEVGESSTAPFLQEDSDGLFPGLMRRDINSLFGRMDSLSRRLCGREMAHALVEKKGEAKDEYYGKLILDLGNEVCSSVEQGTAAMEKMVEKLGNAEEKAECKKLKKELEEARGQDATPVVRECTFAGFKKCNLIVFRGVEGAVKLRRWFEKTKSVFGISKCAEVMKVKFTAATLEGPTLTWWNSKISTLVLETVNQMPWTEMKQLITTEFCPIEELQRMEHELWNLKVKENNIVTYTQRFNELALIRLRMVEPESVKVDAYIRGLTDNITGEVTSSRPTNLKKAVRMAYNLMEQKSQARDKRILEGKKRKWESFQSGNSSGKSNQKDNSRQPS
ncbi:retrotransposable element Tf2 [Tanacetum coccineum]